MDKAKNLSDFLKDIDKLSNEQQKILFEKLSKRAKNISKTRVRSEQLSSVAKSDEKITEKSTSAIIGLVSKLVSTLTVGTTNIEKEFKTSISSDLLKKAKELKSSDIELATKYAFGAKISAAALKTITESNAKSLTDFKLYNSEFESLRTISEFVANQFREMGIDLNSSNIIVKEIAKQLKNAQEAAFQVSRATGETKLSQVTKQIELPVTVRSTKATKESVESLESLVTKIIGDMSFATKKLESDFGSNISMQLLAKAKEAGEKGNFEKATKYLLGAKNAVLSFDAMSTSSAKTLNEFKKLNPEFESADAYAEALVIKFRELGMNVKASDKMVQKLSKDAMQVVENAYTFNKATGETNLQGILSTYEKITQQQEKWNKLSEKLPSFYNDAKEALLSNTAAATVLIGILIDKFTDASKAIKDMSSELGLSVPQGAEMTVKLGEAGAKAAQWGANIEDVANSMKSLSSYSGDLNMATADAAANVSKMTVLTKIDADEAAKLNVLFNNTAGGSQEVANNLANTAINTARINNIAPQKMMKQLADQTDKFAGFTKESTQGLIGAVAMATKLNVEFSKLVDAGEKFLDIQGLIEDTMSTNALLGTNFDFSMAAAKYNAGDLKGFVADLSAQFKGIDLSKMTMIEKRQLTSNLGLSTEDLQNIIKNADKIKNIEGEVTMDTLKNADKLEGVKNSFLDTLFGWATPQNMLMVLATGKLLSVIFGSLFAVLAKASSGVAALGTKLINFFKFTPTTSTNSISATSKLFEGFGKINYTNLLKGAGALAIMSVALIGLAFAMQQFAKNERLWESFGAAAAGISLLTVAVVALGHFATGAWEILLAGAGAMVIMSGALWLLGNALQQFKGVDSSSLFSIAGGLAVLTATVLGLGALGMWGWPLLLIGTSVILGLSAVLVVFGKALQIAAPNMSIFAESLTKIISTISSASGLSAAIIEISNGFDSLLKSFSKLKTKDLLPVSFVNQLSELKTISNLSLVGLSAVFIGLNTSTSLLSTSASNINSFSESVNKFNSSIENTLAPISMFTENLATLTPAITMLSALAESMNQVGDGFTSMGRGLQPFSKSLSTIAPLVPVLESLANISNTIFKTEESKTTKFGKTIEEKETKTTSTDEDQLNQLQLMADDLNQLKDFILSGGANVYIDGKKVGSWLGKMQSNVHVLENRG